jgi:hypothetical protein
MFNYIRRKIKHKTAIGQYLLLYGLVKKLRSGESLGYVKY